MDEEQSRSQRPLLTGLIPKPGDSDSARRGKELLFSALFRLDEVQKYKEKKKASRFVIFDDWLIKRLANAPRDAAELLRVALEEVDEDPRGLAMTLHYITVARGGIDDLGLKLEETTALLNALGRHLAPDLADASRLKIYGG